MLHQVGVGALGPVFRTYEPTRDRLVAVKVFRLDVTPEQAQSLADALSTAAEAGLFHPSIVEPIAAGVEGTVAYRAEEYVAAESLDVALRHYAPAAIDRALPFITQLADAIDFARAAGIGHGALHPRDIFVTPEEARATGFGVVEALERVGLRAPVRRPYSAPERVAGEAWGTTADVFSLGVITFELLTGRRPAGTGEHIGPLTGATGPAASDAVHAVLAQAMDEDPGRRFTTALAFASALEAAATATVESVPAAADTVPTTAAVIVPAEDAGHTRLRELTFEHEPVPDDVVEDAVGDMPPPAGIDERDEPAEAEREEEEFRTEEPEFDDIVAEQQEDEEHSAFARERETGEGAMDEREEAFDDEAVEDLALEPPPIEEPLAPRERFSDDFALDEVNEPRRQEPLFAPAERDVAPHIEDARPRGYSSITEPPPGVYQERPRPAMLPVAIVVILTALLAYGGGYMMGSRQLAQQPAETAGQEVAPPQTAEGGKEYSEQAVTPGGQQPQQPSAEPPPVPPEVPSRTTAPPAKPAAPKTGTIVVESTPSRAGVTVNGVWRGRTPLTLANLAFGSYAVRVVQPGFDVAREQVSLAPELASRTLAFKLQPSRTAPAPARPQPAATTGSLYVDSRPRGARVILDGKFVGTTPLRLSDVALGLHAVRLELNDHHTWRTSTTIVAGQEAKVAGSLDRIR